MQERNAHVRPRMHYLCMDMLQLEFPDAHFQVVLDKGMLDALLTDEKEPTLVRGERMFSEISRVLQLGGRYLCVSLAQAHVLKAALGHFSREGWMVRIHQVSGSEAVSPERQFTLPIFIYVMTKFKKVPGSALCVLEICTAEWDRPVRMESAERLAEAVRERQQYALLRSQLNKHSSAGNISLDLCNAATGKPRYTLHVVDSPGGKLSHTKHFAIFIIPQGRETEWLFGTEEGRKQLAVSAGFQRLVTVALHRDQCYEGMEGIQTELSGKVMELAPPGLLPQQQVPFLSVGGDIGVRAIQHHSTSALSGEYVIEDVKGDDACYFRRLVFLSNRNVIQSEARLLPQAPPKGHKKQKKKKAAAAVAVCDSTRPLLVSASHAVDKSYLCCAHHRAMVAGLALLKSLELFPEAPIHVLVIGLGGGSLPLFIHNYFSQCHVEAVEIDPTMLEVAMRWFDFSLGNRLKVHVADGLDYVTRVAAEELCCYDAIMFDVDSKDSALGMSCPPPTFVEKPFLQKVRAILKPEGIFILNLVCRDSQLRGSVLAVLEEVFPVLYAWRTEEEVNEILFCQLHPKCRLTPVEILERARVLEKALRLPGQAWDSTYTLADMLQAMRIV
uniref:eEF1A lysine and N-terminal methyltransferase n=1 Tax=Sphenodon punctatus TaxID=8508 RepID=A0A8D0HG40_SPHPU